MTPQDSLAAYVFPDVEPRYQRPDDPRRSRSPLVTDPDGERHAARIPSPVAMAESFARPLLEERFGSVRRFPGGRLVAQDNATLPLELIRGTIFGALLALPLRDGLGPHDAYTGVLRVVADDPDGAYLRRYALEVAKASLRRGVFSPPPAVPAKPRAPRVAKTPAQWKADQRARERNSELASAREWLALYLAEVGPGETVSARHLHALAVDAIADLLVDGDDPEREDGTPWRVPGPRTFYAVADSILGERRRAAQGTRVYTIPAPTEETPVAIFPDASGDIFAEDILDRVARLVLEEERETLRAFIARRNAATDPTERGNVTDLSAHRAKRSA